MQSNTLDTFLARMVSASVDKSVSYHGRVADALLRSEPPVLTMLPPLYCGRTIASTTSFSTSAESSVVYDPRMSARERRQGAGVAWRSLSVGPLWQTEGGLLDALCLATM